MLIKKSFDITAANPSCLLSTYISALQSDQSCLSSQIIEVVTLQWELSWSFALSTEENLCPERKAVAVLCKVWGHGDPLEVKALA